jgi:hypothetical protein
MFIDEKGRFIQPDYITALIGNYYLEKEQGNVLQEIRTSRSTTEYLEKHWRASDDLEGRTRLREGQAEGDQRNLRRRACGTLLFPRLLQL